VKPAAIDGGLVLIAEDGEINEAERFSEESTQTQVAQSLASVDHDDWSAVIECLAALSALEKNQDKLENHVVDHAAGGAYEPKNYEDAVTCADASRWIPSMDEEVKEIIANDVWDVVNPPPGVSILTGKFAYKVKTNADGEVTRYKSRWCARGFEQELGVDVLETFASVVKPMSYKLLFALACLLGWSIEQMDVKTAFLYGKIDTDVYMELPPNIKDQYPGKICKLKKALYGLKQSPRIWYLTLSQALRPMGFVAISEDHSVFVNRDKRLVLATYVDDLLILGKDQEAIASVKSALSEHFKMSDLGPVAHYLGVKVIREDTSRGSRIKLTQRAYAEKVLRTFGMADCTPVATPMDENLVLEPSKEASDSQDRKWYQRAVGSLMYLMLCTRPDIAYAVSQLGRFAANPSQKHHAALKRLFRYLKGTSDYGLVIDTQGRPDILTGYTDANWGRDDDRRSTGGYVFTFAGTAISWKSKRQATVSLSSCEAEYIAESEAAKEAIWLQRLLCELRVDLSQPSASEPVTILGDNRGALALAKNPMYHARTKHVDIRYHFVREKVEERLVKMEWIAGGLNPADGLTKPLGKTKFESFRRMVGLRRIDD
jgi:peptidoglycan hydrolase-like protein with peptidoglycan-binding domain